MSGSQTILYEGPFFKKVLFFSIPVMLSSIVQLLFNTFDIIVVGKYVGENALAAIGATSAICGLLVSFFTGLSVGANVVVGYYFGAGKLDSLKKVIGTSIVIAFICGGILTVVGIVFSRNLLTVMGCPKEVINLSLLYMRIYFAGMIGQIVYNFGAAILRALGNTKAPLIYLLIAGVLNIVLNLFFVIVCNAGVAGVALATIFSQFLSAVLVLRALSKLNSQYALSFFGLGLEKKFLVEIIKIGVPASVNSISYMLSNVLIQSCVNSFGTIVVAGNTAAQNIAGYVFASQMAYQQTAVSFCSQNMGAKKLENIKKIAVLCILDAFVFWLLLGGSIVLFSDSLLGIYSKNPEVIGYGNIRIRIEVATYILCGIGDILAGLIRGMGKSLQPMLISMAGICGFRILWIYTYFANSLKLESLYLSYPISWIITGTGQLICFLLVFRQIKKKIK